MNILWFSEISKEDVESCGGKGASLGEMYNVGLPIPQGFVITVQAYKEFLQVNRIDKKIYNILANVDISNIKSLQVKSKEIQEIIMNAEFPSNIKNDVLEAYDNLNVNQDLVKLHKSALSLIKAGRDLPYVAVRSSANAEDSPTVSFAGQQATYLNVKGNSSMINAVKKCWASLFTSRSIYYREKNKIPHDKVLIAVVIQRMINSQKSGIMFTINPSTNNQNEIMIEAGFGLGELIVSGSINPNNYIVDRETLEIKNKKITKQAYLLTRNDYGNTVKKNIPEEKREIQILNDDEIIALAKYGKQIEEHYEKPMDVEFAIESGKIYIVQARPVTTIKKPSLEELKPIKDAQVLLTGLAASSGFAYGKVKIIL